MFRPYKSREARDKARADHRAKYGEYVTPSIIKSVCSSIGEKALLNSKDRHFNDIPLKMWDSIHINVKGSLSDKVCIAKEAARQFIEANTIAKDIIEFEVGDMVTFKPFEIEHTMVVKGLDITVSFDKEDKRVFYGLATDIDSSVTSKATGQCIKQSMYFKEYKGE